jgi:hypothetical protein
MDYVTRPDNYPAIPDTKRINMVRIQITDLPDKCPGLYGGKCPAAIESDKIEIVPVKYIPLDQFHDDLCITPLDNRSNLHPRGCLHGTDNPVCGQNTPTEQRSGTCRDLFRISYDDGPWIIDILSHLQCTDRINGA